MGMNTLYVANILTQALAFANKNERAMLTCFIDLVKTDTLGKLKRRRHFDLALSTLNRAMVRGDAADLVFYAEVYRELGGIASQLV